MTTLETLLNLLLQGWESVCLETHAMERRRKIKNPHDFMQLCLIYLLENCSLMEICEIADLLNIAQLSDVAFMKRFAHCSDWFEWIIANLLQKPLVSYQKPERFSGYRILVVDGSDIMEKGEAPKEWHLH